MIIIPRSIYQTMVAHLQAEYPLEACGLLAGTEQRISHLYVIENSLKSPITYEMEPHQQLWAMLDMEAKELEMMAAYHSHPAGPARPSATDVKQAYYPDVVQLIVSLYDRTKPTVNAFIIVEGNVAEVAIAIE